MCKGDKSKDDDDLREVRLHARRERERLAKNAAARRKRWLENQQLPGENHSTR